MFSNAKSLKSAEECKKYYVELQKVLDNLCSKLRLPFRFDVSHYTSLSSRRWESEIALRRNLDGDGCIYLDTTAPSSLNCAKVLLESNMVGLWGLLQSGKTQAMILAAIFVSCYLYLKTGRITVPLFLTLNGYSYLGQFREKIKKVLATIQDGDVVFGGERISIRHFYENLHVTIKHGLQDSIAEMPNGRDQQILRRLLHENCEKLLVLPCSRKHLPLISGIINTVYERLNGDILLCRDESHYAIADDSITDRILQTNIRDEDLYEVTKADKGRCRIIFCSATNWVCSTLVPAKVQVNEQYCGVNLLFNYPPGTAKWQKVFDDKSIKFKEIQVTSMTSLGEMSGDNFLSFINAEVYRSSNKLSDLRKLMLRSGIKVNNHAEYCRLTERAVAQTISYLLVKNNFKKGRGALIRFVNDNAATDRLVDAIEPTLKKSNIKIIKAYAKDSRFHSAEDLLRENGCYEGNQKYVVFVTNKGRVSDSFPAHCCYGLDYTRKSAHWSTVLQGVLGRMCGFQKDGFVILSDENHRWYRNVQERGGIPIGNVSYGVKAYGEPSYYTFDSERHEHDAVVMDIIDRLNGMIDGRFVQVRNGKRVVVLGAKLRRNLWEECIEPYIDYLQDNLAKLQSRASDDARLLRPGQVDNAGRQYMVGDFGVVAGWREFNVKMGARQGNSTGLPLILRGKLDGRGRGGCKVIVKSFDLYHFMESSVGMKFSENTVPARLSS